MINVTVLGNDTYDFQLVGGSTQYEGRLEVRRNNGTWGTVSQKFGLWASTHATVACRSFGWFPSVYLHDLNYGRGTGPIHLEIKACSGDEMSLLDCTHNGWNENMIRQSNDVVGLKCLPGKTCFLKSDRVILVLHSSSNAV